MRQTEVIIDLIQDQLLLYARLAFAEGGHPPPDCGDMLADAEVDPLHECCVDVPTVWSQEVIDGLQGAKHHAVRHVDQAPAPYGLHHLRIEQLGQWHPAQLGGWTLRLPAWWLHPLPIVGQQGRQILAKAIGEKQWSTGGGQHLRYLVDKALGHRQRTIPDVKPKQQFALGVL